jgi:hypothetical protein
VTRWDRAEFVPAPENALAADTEGVAITLVVEPEAFQIAWCIRLTGEATLADAERMAEGVASDIRLRARDLGADYAPGSEA